MSLTPQSGIVSMEPRREGAPCHKELRSGRVVAVGVNSIGEEINVRKVIPPGFIMILWEEEETVSTYRKEQEGTTRPSGLCLRHEFYHLPSHNWFSRKLASFLPDKERLQESKPSKDSFSESALLMVTHWQQWPKGP